MNNRNRSLVNRIDELQRLRPKTKGGWYWFFTIVLAVLGWGGLLTGLSILIWDDDKTATEGDKKNDDGFLYIGSGIPLIAIAAWLAFRTKK